ncbi:unnamed protein product [Pedinophyceae sp. YPF-701]|nr:unnamed protein product [Pedinophyceae sp. YPF-701]
MIAKAWMREGELAAAERRAAREAERENRLKVLHAGLVPGEPAGDGEGERAGGGQAGGAPGDVADGLARKAFTPLVRIVDGKLALQQDTLSLHHDVERHALVRVDSDKKRLTNQSYSTRPPRDRWSLKDTELFYKALEQFGADFSLIERLFPGRTRPQIKAKYKREEKINPDRVHAAKCAAATRHAESTVTDMQWMLKTVRMAKREQAQE